MNFGYIRVSTTAQNPDRQLDILRNAGAERLFIDKVTGTKSDRPQLKKMFEQLRKGDIIIVTELARFGRSTKDLFALVDKVHTIGAELRSLKEEIDTTSAYGKFFFTINCAYAQLERDLIVQRTKEGLSSARARGRIGGRPKLDNKQIQKAIKLYRSQTYSIKEITDLTGISSTSLYNYLNKEK